MYQIIWYRTMFVREAYQADKVLSKFDWILIFYLLCLFTTQKIGYSRFTTLEKGKFIRESYSSNIIHVFQKVKKNQNGPVEEKETFKCCWNKHDMLNQTCLSDFFCITITIESFTENIYQWYTNEYNCVSKLLCIFLNILFKDMFCLCQNKHRMYLWQTWHCKEMCVLNNIAYLLQHSFIVKHNIFSFTAADLV